MSSQAESRTVYAAGLVQGVVLVTFPAASTIFTSASQYGLSSTQYGAMFLPQAVVAVSSALAQGRLAERFGAKRVYLTGLAANLAAMLLLIVSRFVQAERPVAYGLLLAATACLGAGFGLTVPSLNTFAAAFHPGAVDRSVLVLNSLLGLGTALAPVFVAAFVGLGFWVGLPVLAAAAVVALFAVSARLPLRVAADAAAGASRRARRRPPIPGQFWLFAGFAVLYGFCETMNGNWSQLDLTSLRVSATMASLALTVFWAMVTLGRVLFAAVQRWFPSRLAYHVLPFILAGAFALISVLPRGAGGLGIVAFGLAGFGCSALLPLTISFGQEKLASMAAVISGLLIAFYQLGYGIAAFGVGPLRDAGFSLAGLFGISAVVAVVLGGLSFGVAHGRPSPRSLHPRPQPARQAPAPVRAWSRPPAPPWP